MPGENTRGCSGAASFGSVTWAQFIFAINIPQECWLFLCDVVILGIIALEEQILCLCPTAGWEHEELCWRGALLLAEGEG